MGTSAMSTHSIFYSWLQEVTLAVSASGRNPLWMPSTPFTVKEERISHITLWKMLILPVLSTPMRSNLCLTPPRETVDVILGRRILPRVLRHLKCWILMRLLLERLRPALCRPELGRRLLL